MCVLGHQDDQKRDMFVAFSNWGTSFLCPRFEQFNRPATLKEGSKKCQILVFETRFCLNISECVGIMVDKAEKAIDFVGKHNTFNYFHPLHGWELFCGSSRLPNIEIKAHSSKLLHCCGPGSQEACSIGIQRRLQQRGVAGVAFFHHLKGPSEPQGAPEWSKPISPLPAAVRFSLKE